MNRIKFSLLLIAALVTILALSAVNAEPQSGAKVERIPIPNSDFPISQGVWVPEGYDTLYLSGNIAPPLNASAPKGTPPEFGDTETQTVGVMKRIAESLAAQKLSLSDVVMMHAYLVGDPAKQNKMDFDGFMKGYTQFFGTKTQPNKPARTTVQIVALAAPGALVEIEVIAVRPHSAAFTSASNTRQSFDRR